MTVLEQPRPVSNKPPVSARLTEPLRVVDGRARFMAWCLAIFRFGSLVAAVCLAGALLLGMRAQVSSWWAMMVSCIAGGIVAWGVWRIVWPMFRRPTGLAAAARLVDQALPDSQERVFSAIELSQEEEPAFRGSPELVAVLLRQAEHHAESMDPATVISGRDVMRWLTALGGIMLIWLVMLVVLTPNMLLGMQRLMAPWSAATPLPSPILEVHPGNANVAQGQSLEVIVDVKAPEGLSLDSGHGEIVSAAVIQRFGQGAGAAEVVTNMERTGPRSFRAIFQNLRQSFEYRVVATGSGPIGIGESQQYSVTVHTRPAIAAIETLYIHPAYTRLQQRTERTLDGAIDGLAGTRVRVTVLATEAIQKAVLTLEDDGTGSERALPLEPLTADAIPDPAYAAEFTLSRNTRYRVGLEREDGRDNQDNHPRPITVRPDALPTIVIAQPQPGATALKVRPEDLVPFELVATDDFGVAKIEALIQVDERPLTTQNVDFAGGGDTRAQARWILNLPEILKTLPAGVTAQRVACQFRVYDNRDPDPQTALSSRLVMELDSTVTPLAERLDAQAAGELTAAMAQATERLRRAESRLEDLRDKDTQESLTDENRRQIDAAREDIAEARRRLADAARQAEATRLSDLSRQVRQVADEPMRVAQEQAVKAGLAASEPEARRQSLAEARAQVQRALQDLERIAGDATPAAGRRPLTQEVQRLAQRLQEINEQLERNPGDPALRAQQRLVTQELEQLIREHPELQQPAADAQQPRVDELVRRIRELREAQEPVNRQLDNLRDAAGAAETTRQLAARQQQLNQDIRQYAQQQSEALRQSAAQAPDAARLDPIVRDLQENRLANAAREQRANAGALEEAQNRLEAAQRRLEETTGPRQRAAEEAARVVQNSAELQRRAGELSQQISQARSEGNPPTRPSDPANQQAQRLAEEVRREAQAMAQSANAAVRNAAQNAARAADAAAAAARQGQADTAQQRIAEAANQLAQGAQAQQAAAGPPPRAADSKPGEAARQAAGLAQRQRALEAETAALSEALEQAAQVRGNPTGTTQRQEQIAESLAQAEQDARTLREQTRGNAPELSQKAQQAAEAIRQSAQEQRTASEALRSGNASRAAESQMQSARRLASAEESLTGQPASGGAGQTTGNTPETPGQNQSQPTARGGAGEPPGAGQTRGGSTSPVGRGPAGSASPTGTGQSVAGRSGAPGTTAAAESIQRALDQQQRAQEGDAAAARQAAELLRQAAEQLRDSEPQGGGSGGPRATGEPGRGGTGGVAAPGQGVMPGTGAVAGTGGSAAGQAGTSGTSGSGGSGPGITADGRPAAGGDPPQEVLDVGITPSDWARLPPSMRDQLLHSAQQAGPPGYREMIKNYYSRIARMQAQESGVPE